MNYYKAYYIINQSIFDVGVQWSETFDFDH